MSPEKISLRTMASVTQFSLKYKYWVLALAFIGAGVCTWLTILNAKINTNTEDMISSTVPWRIAQNTFKKDFPLFSDTIVIVVDGPTPDLTDEAAEHLVSKLTDMGLISKQIFYLQNHVFFRENKFLYLSLKEIETLSKRLTTSQAMLGRLAANPDLNGLLALTNEINERSNEMGNLESQKFIITLAEVLERSEDSSIPMSWQDLLGGEPSLLKTHRRLIVIKPTLDFSQILPANKIMSELQELISRFEPDIWPEIAIRLTGPAALGHDELNSVIGQSKLRYFR
jgi:uncharacterized protein